MRERRWLRWCLCIAVLMTACGTRRPHEEHVAAAGVAVGDSSSGGVRPGSTGAGTAPPADGASPDTVGAEQTGVSSNAAQPGNEGVGDGETGSSAAPPTGAPIVIGSVGALSGIASATAPVSRGTQLWAQWANSRGGVAGHPIEVVVADDGGDPARYRATLQRLVEQEHVVAFVGNPNLTTIQAGVDYLEQARVPMIGGDHGSQVWFTSPMLFPQVTAGDGAIWASAAAMAAHEPDMTQIGLIACQEAQICQDAARLLPQYAPAFGLDMVYVTQTSVAQPDFTAECLSARRAGAEKIYIGMDGNSALRVAASCARQGYFPVLSVAVTIDDQLAEAGMAGAMFSGSTAPWYSDATPALAEFHAAVDEFAPDEPISPSLLEGWIAGKLFERAAAGVGETATSDQILEGLWSLGGETLGELTAPLAYARDAPAPETFCYNLTVIADGAWVAPNGAGLTCIAGPP